MNFESMSPQMIAQLKGELLLYLPELALCAGIVVMLLLKLVRGFERLHLGAIAIGFCGLALGVSIAQWFAFRPASLDGGLDAFTGLLVYDSFTVYVRILLLTFAILGIVLTLLTHIPDAEDSGDFYVLFLGGTLGMMVMGSVQHLLMLYIAVEMASLPSYALSGFLKGQRRASEAALKYVVYGGGASGVMLYGISLVAGRFGTGYLPEVAVGIDAALRTSPVDITLCMGLVFILVGLAFKLSAVPFHFWCPDVFEGASAEIGAFLSVASKTAAMALTGRLVLILAKDAGWAVAAPAFGPVLALFAAVTATFGNLAAYPQSNLKRLLAYSTIAHAGYMLMGLSVVNREGVSAVLFYLATYLFTNLGAFAVVAFIRNRTGSEEIDDCRGLVQREPWLVVAMGVCLLSLLGLPPLAGFAGKFVIFSALYHAANEASAVVPWLSTVYWALLVIGGLNTVFSAVYYIRVLKVMTIDQPGETGAKWMHAPAGANGFAGAMAAIVLALGVAWNFLAMASDRAVRPVGAPDSTLTARR